MAEGGSKTDKILWSLIVALAIVDLAIIIAGFMVHVEGYRGKLCYYASVYPGYEAEIRNATFYLPLAWKGDVIIPSPENVSVVDTKYGKMLKMEALLLRSYDGPHDELKVEICLNVAEPINVTTPFSEWVLKPKFNLTEESCGAGKRKCFNYDSVVYVKCNATGSVHVSVAVRGTNYWWENMWWYKRWYQNVYSDRIWVDFEGNRSGWIKANGSMMLVAGSKACLWGGDVLLLFTKFLNILAEFYKDAAVMVLAISIFLLFRAIIAAFASIRSLQINRFRSFLELQL